MRSYKGYVIDQPGFRRLFENFVLVVGHFYEDAYSYNKITKEEIGIFRFEGDPTCAVVGTNNDWCLIGGHILILKTFYDRTVRPAGDLKDIYDLRLVSAYSAQLLTDPWSPESAIWQLDINPNRAAPGMNFWKIRDFHDYLGKRFEANVNW
jgi:hypothetical protein